MIVQTNWSYPNTIWFGVGRIKEIAMACASAEILNPLWVTDKNLAGLPITQNALSLSEQAGLGKKLFSEVDPNPNEKNLVAGIKVFLEGEHDGVIAFGGGSGLDLGKLIAFAAKQSRPIWDFEDIGDWWMRADTESIFPIIAIPTTAGTGSETGRAGILTNSYSHTKKIIFHPKILPAIAILDPELTVGLPRTITVGTGMDALVHCLESYCSPAFHPFSQGIAIEGIKLVKENLPVVYRNPDNLEARGKMMVAAAMGAVALQKGLGAAHAISHQIGSLYDTHHGMTNAVVLPEVLKMNRSAIESKIDDLAGYLKIDGGFEGFLNYIIELRSKLEVPQNLSELGVNSERIEEMVVMALKDPSANGNPVKLTLENTRQLFKNSIEA